MSYIEKSFIIDTLNASNSSEAKVDVLVDLFNQTIDKKIRQIEQNFQVKLLEQKLELFEFFQSIEMKRSQQLGELTQLYKTLNAKTIESVKPVAEENPLVILAESGESTELESLCKISFINHLKNIDELNLSAIEKLQAFLLSCSIGIKALPSSEPQADAVINSIAIFMGERYHAIERIYKKIKSMMQTGGYFKEHIGNLPQQDISSVCQWCDRLFKIAYLEQYSYKKSPYYIVQIKTTTLAMAQNFLSGQWFERYISEKINQILIEIANVYKVKINATYLMNPQVTLPNGDDFELDMLYEINDKIYWIETKTGYYQSYIQKYSKVAKIMNLDQHHAIMVLTDLNSVPADSLSYLFNMKVINIDHFVESFKNLLLNDLNLKSNEF